MNETSLSIGDETNDVNVINFRLTFLETNYKELKFDVKDIKDLCIKMDKRLSSVPEEGLPCQIHTMKMDNLTSRIDKVEIVTDTLNKKIITWTAAFAIVAFLLSQLIFPYIVNNIKVQSSSSPRNESTTYPTNHLTAK